VSPGVSSSVSSGVIVGSYYELQLAFRKRRNGQLFMTCSMVPAGLASRGRDLIDLERWLVSEDGGGGTVPVACLGGS